MLEVDPAAALAAVDQDLAQRAADTRAITNGHGAAVAIVHLMSDSQKRLSPSAIIAADDPSLTEKERAAALWANATVRNATVTSLADSVALLARLWQTAWVAGDGDAIPGPKLVQFSETDLQPVYKEKDLLESLDLAGTVKNGNFEP